jgi:3-carboxy-cis,cis-muconate cycloisomerase
VLLDAAWRHTIVNGAAAIGVSMFHTSGQLFQDAFGTAEMREVFTEESFSQRFMEVEAALARVEADLGLIPEEAGQRISETASLDYLDMEEVGRKVAEIDLFTVAIIETWREEIGEAGEYIHWGATSQDIADTAMVLCTQEGVGILQDELATVRSHLQELATDHAETAMMGRTHHVHALPITFGLKAADWLDELERGIDRLEAAAERASVLQFFGAVGSLASLGEDGIEVQTQLGDELELTVPANAWYASRDRFLELLQVFAALGGTLSRIARQVLMLNREEFGEVSEPIPDGAVGSSTMPHKRNPVSSERVVGLAALLRGHANTMSTLVDGYDERDAGLWYAEYALIPEAFLYLHRALRNTAHTLGGLEVHTETMQENMNIHDGLATSEAVMMALAESAGRQRAHGIVHEVAMEAVSSERDFESCLLDDDRVADALSPEEVAHLTDPANYTGVSGRLARRTVERSRQVGE